MSELSVTFSIIIPVLHCNAVINNTIRHINRVASGRSYEIIVVDGDEQCSTLKVIHSSTVKQVQSPKGRGTQMNRGAGLARGKFLVFLHADTYLPDNAFNEIESVFAGGRSVGGAFDLGFDEDSWLMKVIAISSSFRSRLTRVPFGDQAIFIRKDYFEQIGGYGNIPLMEDVALMRKIKKRGDKISIVPERVRTSSYKWRRNGIVRTTIRNWYIQFLYYLGVSPQRLYTIYYKN